MDINWFYTKKISIYSHSYDSVDEDVFNRDIYTLKQENVYVDVQPSSDKKIYETYGYKVECTKVVYSSIKFDESDIILYNDQTYKITAIIPWDDYYIYAIVEKKVDLNEG